MLNDYIDIRKNEMIDKLIELVRIPSIARENDGDKPCGEEVAEALDRYVGLAQSMGFKARNLGKCAEVVFGGGHNAKKVYIAGHLDVVPAGDGWATDPFTAAIRNGKIYGRGVLDDKGPSLAVLYALKAVKDLAMTPKAEIRIIVGGCEETSMSDLKGYVKDNGLPDYGLTPDSSFPIINAEVGVAFGKFLLHNVTDGKKVKLKRLSAGRAFNCVPDICTATLFVDESFTADAKRLLLEFEKEKPGFEYTINGTELEITTFGKSAHGSVPDQGVNAAYAMLELLDALYKKAGEENSYVAYGIKWFAGDTAGKRIGIACEDKQTGALSLNVGMVEYSDKTKDGFYSFDIRVPVTKPVSATEEGLKRFAKETGVELDLKKTEESTYLDPGCDFLKKLASCYTDITGRKAEFLTARGVTYAKAFGGKGVAFGPIDENDPSQGGNIHGIDEYISADAYISLAKVYALAVKELFC